jgi:hypothetical protein
MAVEVDAGEPAHGVVLEADAVAEGVCAIELAVFFPAVVFSEEAHFVCGG